MNIKGKSEQGGEGRVYRLDTCGWNIYEEGEGMGCIFIVPKDIKRYRYMVRQRKSQYKVVIYMKSL